MKIKKPSILAISGGCDSRYLLDLLQRSKKEVILAHVNHGTRGKESDKDQDFVEKIALEHRIPLVTVRMPERSGTSSGFENRARRFRRRFFLDLKEKLHCGNILTGHTSDDQVETILMRLFEGAGIGGLKGIRRESADGFYRPILDVWREDIIKYLKVNGISFRTDGTNRDTRFERNWIRHVLIPVLEKRYGKAVKKRIYTLGERFREIDEYVEAEATKWIRRNVKAGLGLGGVGKVDGKVPSMSAHPPHPKSLGVTGGVSAEPSLGSAGARRDSAGFVEAAHFLRARFSVLPAALRVRILQKICFDRLGLDPNERLLTAMDKVVCSGGPSAKLKVCKEWELVNRYGRAAFVPAGDARGAGKPPKSAGAREPVLEVKKAGKVAPAQARRAAASGGKEYYDAAGVRMPLSVRPLRAGDRIRPFGLDSEKKVKEILIDRKIPRDERWGRPVVCDAEGKILWIPGVVRSAHAPLTSATRKTVVLGMRREPDPRSRK